MPNKQDLLYHYFPVQADEEFTTKTNVLPGIYCMYLHVPCLPYLQIERNGNFTSHTLCIS